MNQQPKYRIYATLLDAFGAYLNSDVIGISTGGGQKIHPILLKNFTNNSFKN